MKGLFLNLPNKDRIMRRYMCSYNSPTFLFQPIELLSLAGIHKEWKQGNARLIDAIAEDLSSDELLKQIVDESFDFIVSISGFECFEEDIAQIELIKHRLPNTPFVLFGHYATQFPEEILKKSSIDYILHGEPDMVFADWIDVMQGTKDIKEVTGVSYRKDGRIIHQKGNGRIPKPNQLPMPAYELLNNDAYGEPFFPKPYGLIQSARGCPYSCNYCVRSFGTKLTALSPENMIMHVEKYIELFNIKSFRFIDDTFTATPKRVVEFCKLMVDKKIQLEWSCLSRADTLNRNMLEWMKKAGCSRIYIGAESGSEEILSFYNKGIDLEKSRENLSYCKDLGFELMGFFMVGAPGESMEHVQESLQFALDVKFDFITVGELKLYPGTPLFHRMEDEVDFSLLPYKNEFKQEVNTKKAYEQERYFFKKFYSNPAVLFRIFKNKSGHLLKSIPLNSYSYLKYLFSNRENKQRKDFI